MRVIAVEATVYWDALVSCPYITSVSFALTSHLINEAIRIPFVGSIVELLRVLTKTFGIR